MPDEIRIPVNAKIPKSLHDSLLAAVEPGRYKAKTACITEALEILLNNTQEETQANNDVLQNKKTEIQNLEIALREKYAEIQRLQSVIQEAPDPIELAQLRARYEELQAHNETLKADIEKASQDKEDLKQMHNNYFLQVQTLINQKAIEAPGEKKKPKWKFW